MNAKLNKQLIATIAFAAISAADLGSASAADLGSPSAADLGYRGYLHNLDATNAVTEKNVDQTAATANSNADAYKRYQHNNGWIDTTAEAQSDKTLFAGGYQAYLHNLDAANPATEQNVGQAAVAAKSSS